MEYWRVMLKTPDRKNKAAECVSAGYVGVDTAIRKGIRNYLSGGRDDFIQRILPEYMENRPKKTEEGAKRTLRGLWHLAKDMESGDIVLSPSGNGFYYVGEISGSYYYDKEREFFHCRPVKWSDKQILRADMSEPLQRITGTPGTIVNLCKHAEEIKQLLGDTD